MAEENENVEIAALVEELSGSSRRKRQEVAHKLSPMAKSHPEMLLPYVDALADALYRPEAQTRWEVLDALAIIADEHPDEVECAFDGAEASLFDDGSARVRLSAFVFLCHYGATSPERSDQAWPLVDEAVQCFHGDVEYRDMLQALLVLAQGKISKETAKALAARVKFDAEKGSGYIKSFSSEILQAVK